MRRFELEHDVDGRRVELADVVAQLSDNTLQWSIIRFIGTCVPPHGLTEQQFQDRVAGAATGCLLTFGELQVFAASAAVTDDCFVMAATSISQLTTYRLNRDFSQSAAVLQRTGDAPWQLWLHGDSGLATSLPMARTQLRVAEPPPPDYPRTKTHPADA